MTTMAFTVWHTVAVFTWTRITFRKTFRIAIQNVIGIVIWTTCVHMHCNAFPIMIRICPLRGNFAPTAQSARADWPMRLCMALACIFIMHTHESRSERALRSHVLKSGFLGGSRSKTQFFFAFQKPDLKQLCVHMGLQSGFQIRKGPNHTLKRLSERDSSSCEHSHCLLLVLEHSWLGELSIVLSMSIQMWVLYTGWPKKTEQSILSIFEDFALINSYLFSPCWIEHLFLIIITPRSSNLVDNFLFYE